MPFTLTNPADIGSATKKTAFDAIFDNTLFLYGFLNLGIAASVDSKALTISLKGANGNAPSTTNPVTILFRSATLTTGTPVFRTATGALSLVLPSGGTTGFAANETGRIYVWLIDNAGTLELALSRTSDIFPEGNLVSTTAIGTGSDSASVMYSASARTNVACRCIGYIEITTGATAGEWDNAPTKVQVMGPGIKRTGDVVQVAYYSTGEMATTTGRFLLDDNIRQNTEGGEFMTLAITPQSAVNRLIITPQAILNSTSAAHMGMGLFQDTTSNALAATYANLGSCVLSLTHSMIAGTASSTTFKVRAGFDTGATCTFNGLAGTRYYGGKFTSSITITEVFA